MLCIELTGRFIGRSCNINFVIANRLSLFRFYPLEPPNELRLGARDRHVQLAELVHKLVLRAGVKVPRMP